MTKGIMIFSEHIPWLMELKDRIKEVVFVDENVQFRLFRNLSMESFCFGDAKQEFLYVVLGDMCSNIELGRKIQYIRSRHPYAKIVGVRKASESLEVPEAGKYIYRKKGAMLGEIRVVEENSLESYFRKEVKQLETFAQKVYRLREIQEEQEKERKKNEQEGIG